MSRLPILLYGDPRLTRPAQRVGEITAEVRALASDLIETMYEASGRGLAGPQVGAARRLFVLDCFWKDGADREAIVMIDPEILDRSKSTVTGQELCLSIPGLPMSVTRAEAVLLRWTGLDRTVRTRWFSGVESVCIQHEYDHLEGVLISDRIAPEVRAALEPALAELAAQGGTV